MRRDPSSASRVRPGSVLAAMVLVVGLASSVVIASQVRAQSDRSDEVALDRQGVAIADAVDTETNRYVDVLTNVAAATGAFDEITASEFAMVTEPLRTMRLPGATSIALMVAAEDDEIAALQADGRALGTPELTLVPGPLGQEHIFSIFRTSLDGGTSVAGTDAAKAAEPKRALDESRRTGRVSVSDTYKLLLDKDLPVDQQQFSFVLSAPVYGPAAGTGQRPFRGWVLMGLRGQDFIGATLAIAGQDTTDVTLQATNSDGAEVEVAHIASAKSGTRAPTRELTVRVAQREWRLEMAVVESTLPGSSVFPAAVLGGGILLTSLLAALVFTLASSRARARAEVLAATAELRAADADSRRQAELLEAIVNSISDGVSVVDEDGRFLLQNPEASTLLGVDALDGTEHWQEHYGLFHLDGITPYETEDLPAVRALRGDTVRSVQVIIRNSARPVGTVVSVSARRLQLAPGRFGVVAVMHDETAVHEAALALRRDSEHSETIAAVAATIAASHVDTQTIAETITTELATRIGDQAVFLLHDASTGLLEIIAIASDDPVTASATRAMIEAHPLAIDGPSPLSRAASERVTTVIDIDDADAYADQFPEEYRDLVRQHPTRHLLQVPLVDGGQLLGVIIIARHHVQPFGRRDLDLVEEVGVRASYAMISARLFEQNDRAEQSLRAAQADLERTNRSLQQAADDATRERDFSTVLLGAMHEGYLFIVDGEIRDVNEQFCALTGFPRDELVGQTIPYSFWPPEEAEASTNESAAVRAAGGGDLETTLIRKDGERFPAQLSVRTARNADGSVHGLITTFTDISVFKDREDELIASAGRDPLTDLFNRRSIDDQFARLRPGDAVIVLDLDHFKSVNDTHGHAAGDQTIIAFARCITDTLRGKDWAGRLGGEEFIIVARDGGVPGAASIVSRLRARYLATEPLTTFSAGIAVHSQDGDRRQTLARADEAMYLAKRNGRDRTETAVPEDRALPRVSVRDAGVVSPDRQPA